ncbi:phosphoribosyltransferase-like protein [Boletus reticuloceps]|uniref:adenine phosphoribosyltransferase n=1 Tax=Boletus reticuloceps TaxID=495285 RepID=A0A8I2YWX2_9AGAM|nr:phosphoribosyltransferase-like protein [Boletus reticuloceps]
MSDIDFLQSIVTRYPDFPKPGIVFLDIFPIFRDPVALETLITHFVYHITSHTIPKSVRKKVDVVVGLDARGFLIGPLIALRLGAAFVPVRKKGKLPGPCKLASYEKEYGIDTFEMQEGAIRHGQNVVIVDDLIATGGSASAAGSLVRMQGGNILEYLFIVEVSALRKNWPIEDPVYSIIQE